MTNLWQELEIYSSRDNIPVWRLDWQPAIDKSNTRLTDFYITHRFSIPERLSVGSYVLKVRVKDEAAGSIAESSIPFQIVADPSLAAVVR